MDVSFKELLPTPELQAATAVTIGTKEGKTLILPTHLFLPQLRFLKQKDQRRICLIFDIRLCVIIYIL